MFDSDYPRKPQAATAEPPLRQRPVPSAAAAAGTVSGLTGESASDPSANLAEQPAKAGFLADIQRDLQSAFQVSGSPFSQQDFAALLGELDQIAAPEVRKQLELLLDAIRPPQLPLSLSASGSSGNATALLEWLGKQNPASRVSPDFDPALDLITTALERLSRTAEESEEGDSTSSAAREDIRKALRAVLNAALPSLARSAEGSGQSFADLHRGALARADSNAKQILITADRDAAAGDELRLLLGTVRSLSAHLQSPGDLPAAENLPPRVLAVLDGISQQLSAVQGRALADPVVRAALTNAIRSLDELLATPPSARLLDSAAETQLPPVTRFLPDEAKSVLTGVRDTLAAILTVLPETAGGASRIGALFHEAEQHLHTFDLEGFIRRTGGKDSLRLFVDDLQRGLAELMSQTGAPAGRINQAAAEFLSERLQQLAPLREQLSPALQTDGQLARLVEELSTRLQSTAAALAEEQGAGPAATGLERLFETLRRLGAGALEAVPAPERRLADELRRRLAGFSAAAAGPVPQMVAADLASSSAAQGEELQQGLYLLASSIRAVELAAEKLQLSADRAAVNPAAYSAAQRVGEYLRRERVEVEASLRSFTAAAGPPAVKDVLNLLIEQQRELSKMISSLAERALSDADPDASLARPAQSLQRLLSGLSLQQSSLIESLNSAGQSPHLDTSSASSEAAGDYRFVLSQLVEDLSLLAAGIEKKVKAERAFSDFIGFAQEQLGAFDSVAADGKGGIDTARLQETVRRLLARLSAQLGEISPGDEGTAADAVVLAGSRRSALNALNVQLKSLLTASEAEAAEADRGADRGSGAVRSALELLRGTLDSAAAAQGAVSAEGEFAAVGQSALERLSETLSAFGRYRAQREARELVDTFRAAERRAADAVDRQAERGAPAEAAQKIRQTIKETSLQLEQALQSGDIEEFNLALRSAQRAIADSLEAAGGDSRSSAQQLKALADAVAAFLERYAGGKPQMPDPFASASGAELIGALAAGRGPAAGGIAATQFARLLELLTAIAPPGREASELDLSFFQSTRNLARTLSLQHAALPTQAAEEVSISDAINQLQQFYAAGSGAQSAPNMAQAAGGSTRPTLLSSQYAGLIPELIQQLRLAALYPSDAAAPGAFPPQSSSTGLPSSSAPAGVAGNLEALLSALANVPAEERTGALRELLEFLLRPEVHAGRADSAAAKRVQGAVRELLAELDRATKGEMAGQRRFIGEAAERLKEALAPVENEQDKSKYQAVTEAIRGLEQIVRGQEALSQINPLMQLLGEPAFLLFPHLIHGMLQRIELVFYPNYLPPDGHRQKNQGKFQKGKDEGEQDGEERAGRGQKNYRRVRIQFRLPELGPIAVDFAHSKTEAVLNIRCEREEAAGFISDKLPRLEATLRGLGFSEVESDITSGAIAPVRPQWVEDLAASGDRIA